jgi:hypothetical protein
VKRQDSTTANAPGTRIDEPGEPEESNDAERAGNEECCQHDLNVTKRNEMYHKLSRKLRIE